MLKNRCVRSAFNYTGGKFKLLPQLLNLFPPDVSYDNFIDLFCGGGSVGLNVEPRNRVYMNDKEQNVIQVFKVFISKTFEELLNIINDMILEYGLSDVKRFGYDFYGMNSSTGLGRFNKEPYARLRYDYNNGKFSEEKKVIAFYLLTVFGFNNQIRFNKRGEYNLPVGKRDFNANMEKKLREFHKVITEGNFEFSSIDFRLFNKVTSNDFLYADPPYRISTASYNENGGWGIQDDLDLFLYLDSINKKGTRFALSNVIRHNGKENKELVD